MSQKDRFTAALSRLIDPPPQIGLRWEDEADQALTRSGYYIVERAGIVDYQGWGCTLGHDGEKYAILSWSYGSCSGCDGWEGKHADNIIQEMKDSIEICSDEASAKQLFQDRKGW